MRLAAWIFLAAQEGVKVGDEDGRRLPPVQLLRGRDAHGVVVVLRIVGQQHAEPVADGDARRDDQESIGEALVLRIGLPVERLPGDEHGHQHGLAGAGRHLEGETRQAAVVLRVLRSDDVERLGVAGLLRRLGQVDGRLRGFDLAEEEAPLAVLVVPVLEEVACDGRDVRVVLLPPATDRLADLIDDLVGLLARGAAELVHRELRGELLGPRDGDEELARAAARGDLTGHLAVRVHHEVARRLHERRVDDRVLDRGLRQYVP